MSNSNMDRALEMVREISQMDTETLRLALEYLEGHYKARDPQAVARINERLALLEAASLRLRLEGTQTGGGASWPQFEITWGDGTTPPSPTETYTTDTVSQGPFLRDHRLRSPTASSSGQ